MADIIITPASGLIDFQNVSGISSATIQLDGSGNLNIGASAGDIQIGDTTSDVYIGNGVDNVDIIFEQDGEIRGLTGKTITLGQSDSFIAFGGNITGVTTFTGNIVAPTFTSTQATGTAPFTVSSTTVVTNLNVDLLDGQQGSYYNDLTNATGTLADARLSGTYTGVSFNSTGIATFTSFSGSGASLTNIPNAALDNSTVSYGGVTLSLGGSDATPAFNLQDATGLPVSTGISGLGANIATFLATPSSSNLAAAVTGETGSGALVFATSPTLVTPILGNATATTINVSGVSTFGNNVNIAGTVGIGTAIDIVPYDTLNSGTLSFEGSAGQLFSITNNLTSGSIFSVNDVSGIPSIDVDADGTIQLATYGGNVGVGTTNPAAKLDVRGDTKILGGSLTIHNDQTTLGYGHVRHYDNYHSIILRGRSPDASGSPTAANEMSFVEYGGIWNFYKTTGTDNKNVIRFREDTGDSWIDVGGSLGIGSTAPTVKLDVNGTVKATIFESTVASGTAPFIVASDTQVANLNASRLQGYTPANSNTGNTIVRRDSSGNFSAGTITATLFSGSGASLTNIPNAALDNSTVSYGGVTLSLGGSDATPAFDLQDATNYPYSSLTGITTDIVGDATPQLGGDLDLNSNDITGTGNIDITGSLNVTGVSTFTSTVEITPSSNVKALVIDSTSASTENNPHITLKGNGPQVIDFRDQTDTDGIRIAYRTTPNEWKVEKSESSTYNFIVADRDDGRVDLYYGGDKKFETTGIGATVYGTLQSQQVNVSGVVTATSFVGDGSNITGIVATNATNVIGGIASITSLNVSGISTLGTLTVSSGIVTATTGIITYYGDGSKLTGLTAQARVVASQTPPTSPTEGDLWYHTTLARLFVYFNDGDSDQWVDASPFNVSGGSGSGTNVSIGATAPLGPYAGDLWYNSDYGRLFIYYQDEDSNQWVDAAPFNFSGITTATYTENSFVATAGQTSFTVSYEVGYVDVFINGIRLSSSEYTASDGSSVVLDDGATEGDVVDIIEVATNRGPTGARGTDGSGGPLENVTETTDSSIHYPLFAVGIGTTLPYITTTSDYFEFIPSSGTLTVNQLNVGVTTLGVTTATNLTVQSINCSGVATALDFNSTSDANLKKDVKVIDNPVEKVSQLNGVSFNWTDTGQSSAGVIAQDVEKVMPEIIRNNPTGYKSLNYNGLIGLLIEAVKEQNETIKSLEQKINTLEERLS